MVDEKVSEEILVEELLRLTEENTKLLTILKAHGLLPVHRESQLPVV